MLSIKLQIGITPITAHERADDKWHVENEKIFVDENRQLVYFIANKDDLIQRHLYVVAFSSRTGSEIYRFSKFLLSWNDNLSLTTLGCSNKQVCVDVELGLAASVQSNLSTSPQTCVYKLVWQENSKLPSSSIRAQLVLQIVTHNSCISGAQLKYLSFHE